MPSCTVVADSQTRARSGLEFANSPEVLGAFPQKRDRNPYVPHRKAINVQRHRERIALAACRSPLALIAGLVAACHGGASDVVGGGGLANAHTSITLVAYSVPEPGWSKVIPAFNASEEGKGVQVVTSYGASGDQSRGVVDGKPADVVNFSVEPDITRLVKAGKVSKDWNTDATKGIPFGSVVTLVVREGQSEEHQGLG